MRPVSETLLGIVTGPHKARCRVRTVTGFPQSTSPAGAGQPLDVVDGSVTMDSTAEVRSTLDLTVRAPWGSLLPDGRELFVEYGVEVSGGSFEWVSLGYYRVDEVTQEGWDGRIKISGSDRMAQVRDTENMMATESIPEDATDLQFYKSLLYGQAGVPWMYLYAGAFPNSTVAADIVFDYDAVSTLVGYQQPLSEGTYYEMMRTRAERLGKRLFFDYKGRLNVVNDVVTPKAVPDLEIKAGPGGQLSNLRRQVTRRGVYTSVRVTGQQSTENTPPWAWAAARGGTPPDPAPLAPDWHGKFGRIVHRFSSPLLTTQAACDAAARTLMGKVQGLPSVIEFDMLPNPGLETLDTIGVTFPDNPVGAVGAVPNSASPYQTREVHVVDRLTIPLTGGLAHVTTRAAWVVVP